MDKNKMNETQVMTGLKDAMKKEKSHSYRIMRAQGPVYEVIAEVCDALLEKGYNPINQIVGYILSGDPTYITSYKNARTIMSRLERDELLEEFVNYYLANNNLAE